MILLISAVFPPEPVVSASITYDLAIALSETREVRVLTPKPSRPFGFSFNKDWVKNGKFKQIILESFTCPESNLFGRMRESYSFGKHSANFIKKNRKEIECIYLNTWPLLSQYLIVKASKKYSIPSVIHVQDIYPESLSSKIRIFGNIIRMMLLPIDNYSLRNVSKIVAISDKMLKTLIQTRDISAFKIEIVQNWQNEGEFIKYKESHATQNAIETKGKPFTFMYLGNIGPVAGVDFLIESFAKANLKETLLVIAGSGSNKGNCLKIAESFKNSRIEFYDVPSGKVPEIQEKADVMLLNVRKGSAMNSIPSKLPAYMFSEKPILASIDKESDTAHAIMKANCGWVVPPEDIDALSIAMRTIVSTPELDMKSFARNGFIYAMENYSKKTNLQKLVSIINEVLPHQLEKLESKASE